MEEKSTPLSRSVSVFIIIITLIAVSTVIPAKWLGLQQKKQLHPTLDLSSLSAASEIATDSDHDGTISWNEIVTETLHPSPEAIENLKKNPVDAKEIADLNDPNNLTSSFAKNLYLAGAYLKKNNITDDTSRQDTFNSLIDEERAKIVETTYSYNDFNVAKTESKESIRVYGNTIAATLENIITEKIIKDDISSIDSFTKSKQASDLIPLIKNKERLNIMVTKLLKMPVPPSALIFHISTTNKVTAYRDLVSNLAGAENDPLRATLVIDKYMDTIFSAGRVFFQLSDYFNTKNIVFSSKEKGYMFTTEYSTK